ncbi:glycoside hydrolase family 3 N-terminal domain-containing protein [Isoptericola chiayiensis]|uniref:Glycoside hydrolase family 3 N-terminal domain-containing protein n=1 Tax=Isoptericola chiayiensis TaxID=579446 RepID=A0ABP8YQY4_9MICO|nr:glycoside hydrolase family 3 protein [Isoptericola chiayiensis]NOW01828.1 beta-N-acetylhexosaminidase [Isoptericola chiayiensis]
MTALHHEGAHGPTTLRRAVLGVLLPGFTGTSAPDWLLDAARDGLAGVVLFGHNTPDVRTTAALTSALHDAAPDLLVTIDEEGGDVSRLEAATGSSIPSAAALGAIDDVRLTADVASALGRLLAACGVDLDLAPVLDVDTPGNPVIGTRAFGDDAGKVSRHGRAFVRGLRRGGVGACAKHFPGHGSTTVDSHVGLPRVDRSLDALRRTDLVPFVDAQHAGGTAGGMDAVMVAHVVVPELGPGPASLEPATVALARELGIDGPVITDALDMRAVSDGTHVGEAAVRAIEAGADLLCLGTTAGRDDASLLADAVDALTAALASGRLTADRLAASAERNARCAAAQRARRERATAPSGLEAATRALHNLAEVGRTAARAAVRWAGPPRPVITAPVVVDLRRRTDHAAGHRGRHVTDALHRRWEDLRMYRPDDVLPGSTDDPQRPVVLVTREAPGSDQERRRFAPLIGRPGTVVLHTGVPSSLEQWFEGTDGDSTSAVLAYGTGRATADAAVRLLAGGGR